LFVDEKSKIVFLTLKDFHITFRKKILTEKNISNTEEEENKIAFFAKLSIEINLTKSI